jgi:hypothetical protein
MDMSEYIRRFRSEESRKKILTEEEKDEILDILSTLSTLLVLEEEGEKKDEILDILSTLLVLLALEEEEEEEDDLSKETEAMDAILLDVYLKGVKKGIQTSQKSLDYEDEDDEGPARWRVLRNGVALPIFFKNKEQAKNYIYELIERQQDFNYYELALMDSLIFKH